MALVGGVVALVVLACPARAQTASGLVPKASILIDADTGAVLDGTNIHEALPPASLTKVITALAAVAALEPGTEIPISARAAGMPAHNMNMKAGQIWTLEDVLGSLLVSSANDAGMALAERVSGTAENFAAALAATAKRLGMADNPVLQDASGLDDSFSINGGNRISARDLAIAARAVLAEPRLSLIVSTPVLSFKGGDGIEHRLGNHNKLLTRYPGAVGMKTGYTSRSLHSLIAAASRDGRTMVAVILNSPVETYTPAAALLDKGFATPVSAEPSAGRLPAVVRASRAAATTAAAPSVNEALDAPVEASTQPAGDGWFDALVGFLLKVLLAFAAAVVALRVRAKRRLARNRATRKKVYRVPPLPRNPRELAPAHPALSMAGPTAPKPSRPLSAERSRPRPSRPITARVPRSVPRRKPAVAPTVEEPTIDPRLAKRFEILVRTGQVVP
ncbi:MAG TPA: serine hydrolase [Acidimicrobiales bacterium]|nr:serine hydrolase [Acidimicrobiales bacterium]